MRPILDQLHPDQQYFIGHDVGIYYEYVPDEVLKGCRAPDWFYVPNTTPTEPSDGGDRRSFVMWKEKGKTPYLIIEQVSADEGATERDRTVGEGKMWVYETVLKSPYYAIFEGFKKDAGEGKLEVYQLIKGKYRAMKPDANGRYLIPTLNVFLGIEDQLTYQRLRPWLRFYDLEGKLLPSAEERAKAAEELIKLAEDQTKLANERAQAAEAEIARLQVLLRQQEDKPT